MENAFEVRFYVVLLDLDGKMRVSGFRAFKMFNHSHVPQAGDCVTVDDDFELYEDVDFVDFHCKTNAYIVRMKDVECRTLEDFYEVMEMFVKNGWEVITPKDRLEAIK